MTPGPSRKKAPKKATRKTATRRTAKDRPRLPPKPTRAQKDAAAKMSLTKKQQKTAWTTTSTFGLRLEHTHAELDALLRELFPDVQATFDYNMRGWKIRRKIDIASWTGTIDPNWIRIYVAERKQGITLHIWNPYKPMNLEDPKLTGAGFKVMVGCLQYNRKGPVPIDAVKPMLQAMSKAWAAEGK